MAYSDLTEEQQDYYELELLLTKELYNNQYEKLEKLYNKEYESNKSVLLLLGLLIEGLEEKDKLSLPSDKIEELKSSFNKEIKKIKDSEIKSENKQLDSILTETIKLSNAILGYLSFLNDNDFNYTNVDNEIINNILNYKIDNKTYKDRTKNNKEELFNKIISNLILFISGEITLGEMQKALGKYLKQNKNSTKKMLINEITRVSNSIKEQFRLDNNIDKVIYCNTLEGNVCDFCANLNGNIYDINDENKPKIPEDTHVNCKCFYISIPRKWSSDTIDIDNINYESFLNWLNDKSINELLKSINNNLSLLNPLCKNVNNNYYYSKFKSLNALDIYKQNEIQELINKSINSIEAKNKLNTIIIDLINNGRD